MDEKGGNHVFPSKIFGLTVPKNFVGEDFGVSENFGYRKFLCIRERGGITFLRRKLLSHRTEKLRWGTVRCFRKFRVSQIFMHTKGISLNSLKNFCHTVPIKFAGEHFCVSKEFWYRKFPSKGGGKLHGFVENFLSHRTEKPSPGNHSVFQKISGREKFFMDKRVGEVSQFSVEKFLSHCTKIFHWRTLWCFRKIFLIEIFHP